MDRATRWIFIRSLENLKHSFSNFSTAWMLRATHLLGKALRHCPSKKQKGDNPYQTCSHQAEAKKDYRVERCMAGPILHGQISFCDCASSRLCLQCSNLRVAGLGIGADPQAGLLRPPGLLARVTRGRLPPSQTLRLRFPSPQKRPDELQSGIHAAKGEEPFSIPLACRLLYGEHEDE